MPTSADDPFTIATAGDTTTITLPSRRNRPLTRIYGLVIVLLAILAPFILTLLFHLAVLAHTWHLFFGIFSLVSYGIGLAVTAQISITLRPDSLITTRRIGPFTTATPIPPHAIARLELDVPDLLRRSILPNNTSLNAELASGGRIPIAQGYPRELLTALASELSARIHAIQRGQSHPYQPDDPAPLAVVDVSDIPPIARDVLTQPPKSMITAAELDGLHTFIIKRLGTIRRRAEFITVVVLLSTMMVAAIGLSLFFWSEVRHHRDGLAGCIVFGIATLVLLITLLRTIHTFRRQCILIVAPDSLTRVIRAPFRKTQTHWSRHEIAGLRTNAPGTRTFRLNKGKIGDLVLVLTDTNRRKTTLVTGDELEVRWLATQLRAILQVPNA